MPCFKGLAVSIHSPDGPIAEHAVQRNSRANRISSYIPVPPARVPPGSETGKPEQSTFSISITLLTPGLNVPYSTPKPTPQDPYPRSRIVGSLPGQIERGHYTSSITPYLPRTDNPNETIAAYIYFDGRVKEEVATLLRKGEETWVNSRWVSVPDEEGGGLAEREFLFREVGLERWLNGLDLEGSKDKAERIEKRQRRLEKKRRKKQDGVDGDMEQANGGAKSPSRNGVLRYGGDGTPVEEVPNEEGFFSDDSDADDEPPQPEAAGQIRVSLFRVLASGEIKRGEYSPQFDAHDDDEGMDENGASNGDGADNSVDHTTSFAKPKTLDPKTISTQTVTGLDPPEAPYAIFTFLYRGEKQLQKMGILPGAEQEKTPVISKRKASGPDFSKFGPLKSAGTVGYSGYRDSASAKRRSGGKAKDDEAMDSDADDDDDVRVKGEEDLNVKQEDDDDDRLLSPEDARRAGALADGVQKIKLKRQHSAEPLSDLTSTRKSPYLKSVESPSAGTPQSINSTTADAGTPPDSTSSANAELSSDAMSSPFKRHRSSVPGLENNLFAPLGATSNAAFAPPPSADTQSQQQHPRADSAPEIKTEPAGMDSDEEL